MDDNIIKGCIKNKRKCQEILYKELSPKMMVVCLRYANNIHEAEDYLHNGFLKLFDNINKFNFNGSFEGWSRKLFRNLIINEIKNNNKIIYHETNDFADTEINIDTKIIDDIDTKYLIELIQKLTPAYRLVFNLYVIDDFSHKEISEKLNISIGTSKSNLYKAKGKLKKMLIDYGFKR